MKKNYIAPTLDELIITQVILETSGIDVSDNEHDEGAGQFSKSRFSFGESEDDALENDSFSY